MRAVSTCQDRAMPLRNHLAAERAVGVGGGYRTSAVYDCVSWFGSFSFWRSDVGKGAFRRVSNEKGVLGACNRAQKDNVVSRPTSVLGSFRCNLPPALSCHPKQLDS